MTRKPRNIIVHMMKESAKRVHIVKTDKHILEFRDCIVYRALNFIEIHTYDKLVIIPIKEIEHISYKYERSTR